MVVLRGLSQGLDHDSEGDSALGLHLLVLRGSQGGGTHEPWCGFALVVADRWHRGLRWEVQACRTVLAGSTSSDLLLIEEAERPW